MALDIKSPFKVYQEFLSIKECDMILERIKNPIPNVSKDGIPQKMERFDEEAEQIVFRHFSSIIPELESYYDLNYDGTEKLIFQHYPEGKNGPAEEAHCENSNYLRKKWVKTHNRDLTGVLWLSDYQNNTPLDTRYEVYGGKLEFPAYNFSLVPQRGTLVIYPAGPHFISAISPVLIGDLYQVRFHIAAKNIWLYQPSNFNGTYVDWFKEYA
jgi:hypothetical protein